jgi:hypothetical protein
MDDHRHSVIHHPDEASDDVAAEIQRHVARAAELDPWLREHPPGIEWWPFRWPGLARRPRTRASGACARASIAPRLRSCCLPRPKAEKALLGEEIDKETDALLARLTVA